MHTHLVLQAMVTIAPFHRLRLLKQTMANHFNISRYLRPLASPNRRFPSRAFVGAFRPQRSPPPDAVIPSADGSVAWHPPPNFYSRSLTPQRSFKCSRYTRSKARRDTRGAPGCCRVQVFLIRSPSSPAPAIAIAIVVVYYWHWR
jgi:hypothetical protein